MMHLFEIKGNYDEALRYGKKSLEITETLLSPESAEVALILQKVIFFTSILVREKFTCFW